MDDSPYTIEAFTASDGYRTQFRRYLPPGPSRGNIVYLHGIQSHAGWYEYSSTRLAQAGFTVSFLDRRGAGLNHQDRGDAPGFKRLIDDVAEMVSVVRGPRSVLKEEQARLQRTTDNLQRTFLLGVSWGGKLAVALERRHAGLVDGLILLCPGLFPQIRLPLRRRLGILFSRIVRPRKLYPIPLSDPNLFTQTPRWLEFLRADPLALHQATARFLFGSARLDRYIRAAPKYVRTPVLLLLAERDRIIDNARTRKFVEKLTPSDTRIIEYPGAHHTLEFEPEPDTFIGDITTWLDRHAP